MIDIVEKINKQSKRYRKFNVTYSQSSQCASKARYTFRQSEKAAKILNREKNIEFHQYHCCYCKHYHVGRI